MTTLQHCLQRLNRPVPSFGVGLGVSGAVRNCSSPRNVIPVSESDPITVAAKLSPATIQWVISVSTCIKRNGHDLRIAIDNGGVVASVALDSNVSALSVTSHGLAAVTRAFMVAELSFLNDTGIVALPIGLACFDRGTREDCRSRQFCNWRSDGLRKSQHWECCDESEDRDERQPHHCLTEKLEHRTRCL